MPLVKKKQLKFIEAVQYHAEKLQRLELELEALKQATPAPNGVWEQILHQPVFIRRFLFVTSALCLILLGAAALFATLFKHNLRDLSIEVTERNSVVITSTDEQVAWFLLSASGHGADTPWVNTAIEIQKGACYTIAASGRVNLAVHRMVEAAVRDEIPRFAWVGPTGRTHGIQKRADKDRIRRKLLLISDLDEDHDYGRLIGQIGGSDVPIHPSPSDSSFINIGDNAQIEPTASGTLWVTINDIWISETTISRLSLAERIMADVEPEIRLFTENHYPNVWYDDNMGFVFITVKKHKNGC